MHRRSVEIVKAYNDTLHSTTGMAPSRVTHSELAICRGIEVKRLCVLIATSKFRVGQHVRISIEDEVCKGRKAEFQYFNI